MARSRLTNVSLDLVTDAGAILWSMVKGEQLEFPITLNFILDASVKPSNNYIYEAVVVEAANVLNQSDRPTQVQPGGAVTRLFVRLPKYLGAWRANASYTKEDVVLHENVYYKLLSGFNYVGSITPNLDPKWSETALNRIYVQFPTTLAANWLVQPTAGSASYGFFELRVSEPSDIIFAKTFKPVRGMVEILFSPTDEAADTPYQTTL